MQLAAVAAALALAAPTPTAAFSGFGTLTATATYDGEMRFSVQLPGGAPEQLELLLRFAGSDSTVVAPVDPGSSSAEYIWDTADRHITPNTTIAYRWRATNGEQVTLSPEKTLLYDDDRPGLDWHTAKIGAATVHWYGGAESQARHFGSISADAAAAAETLLGHDLVGPIDIFVYDSRDDFFGALGPGAREWTGAATYPELRTIFMWLGGGSSSYLETTMTHEVTHVVFRDATTNPFHDPATWFNEGLAVWSEEHSAADQEGNVRSAASDGRLLAFGGITESFPIGDQAARLAYSEGATMVDLIVDTYGHGGMARGMTRPLRRGPGSRWTSCTTPTSPHSARRPRPQSSRRRSSRRTLTSHRSRPLPRRSARAPPPCPRHHPARRLARPMTTEPGSRPRSSVASWSA